MKRIVVVVFSLAAFQPVLSQQAVNKLTFKEAVKIGLDNNLILNQQENLLMTAQVNKTAGLFGMGPTLSINGNAGRNDGNSFNQQQGEVINGVVDFIGTNITASIPLFNGLNSLHAYKQTSIQYDAQLHLIKRTSQDVITNIANQYLTCLLDKQLVQIQEKNLQTQFHQYQQIKEQAAVGSRAEVDVFNQEYQVKNAELLLLRARIALKNNRATLAQTLQLDPSVLFELEEPDWDINLSDAENLPVESLYELAIEKRSDLAQARAIEKAASFGYMASKGFYFPNVSLFAQYGLRYNYIHRTGFPPDRLPQNRDFEQQFLDDNTQLTYGISFTIPLFRAFQTRSTVVQNKVLYENFKLSKKNLEITVKTDVLRAYQNYTDAKSNFEATVSQLKAAEISYELEKHRYELGVSDIVALTLATQNFTRAQADYESSKYTLMFQWLLINYATGTLKLEDLP